MPSVCFGKYFSRILFHDGLSEKALPSLPDPHLLVVFIYFYIYRYGISGTIITTCGESVSFRGEDVYNENVSFA